MKKITLIAFTLVLAANWLLPSFSSAQLTTLYNFPIDTLSGSNPNGDLYFDGTFLYGMTTGGGVNGRGAIFKIKPDGTGYSDIYEFTNVSGGKPYGSLISDGAFLYGMTSYVGTQNNNSACCFGTIFKIRPDGTQFSKLFEFSSSTGQEPHGSLILDGSFLYGMTKGNIFKIQTDGTQYTNLMNFNSTTGSNPFGSLYSDGTYLYGITTSGGANGIGTIFKVKTDGTGCVKLTDVYANGSYSYGSIISDGTFLYGMASSGGANGKGTIFKLMPDGTGCTTILDFNDTNGSGPNGSLFFDGTFLYGMTANGGTYGFGTIFKIKPDGTGYVNLLHFTQTNGSTPMGSLISDGTFLYGMSSKGGAVNDFGTIFKIKTDGTGFVNLQDFSGYGKNTPCSNLISIDTVLYGMTTYGGKYNLGSIFKINADGTGYEIILDFDKMNGSRPHGSLVYDGTYLYGTTTSGSYYDYGTVFKIKPDGMDFNIIRAFDRTVGKWPKGQLVYDDGYLYGSVQEHGDVYGSPFDCDYLNGYVFRVRTDGAEFSSLICGGSQSIATSNIINGNDLYFTRQENGGGNGNVGSVFKLDLSGSVGTVAILTFGGMNATPNLQGGGPSPLIFDGIFLYGTTGTAKMGDTVSGTIYKIKPDGTGYTQLYGFDPSLNKSPNAPLILHGNFLYGTTIQSGNNGQLGSIFKIKKDGTMFSYLYDFTGFADGERPNCFLNSNGTSLYGYTEAGGAHGVGTLFKYQYCTAPVSSSQSYTINAGQQMAVGTNTYALSGTYSDILSTAIGCDSIVTTHLTVIPQLATVITGTITDITATTATGNGNVTNDGTDPNVISGFCYSASANPTIANLTSYGGYATGVFSGTLSILNPNTTYYVRAYATNAAGTSYGIQKQFTTGSASLPVVTTDSITNITATRATGYGSLTSDGNDPNAVSGFCYNTSANPSVTDNTVYSYNNGIGSFPIYFYNLMPNTTYYVKAFSTNAKGTSYGSQMQFTTGNAIFPVVTTDSIIRITATTAYAHGNLINNGNDPGASVGFCFNTFPNPAITDTSVYAYVYGTGSFNTNISGLNPNTVYYVRAYSTNVKGTSYGSQKQFTTGNDTLPTLTTDSIVRITATSVYAYGNIINNGNDPGASSGFCFSASSNPTITDSTVNAYIYYYNGSGSFSTTINDLNPNTTYYVRAYSTNATGTSYGSQKQFTTGIATLPVVRTDSVNTITNNSAYGYGNVLNKGNDPNTSAGFCFGTSANPVISDSTAISSIYNDGAIYPTMYGLNPNTTYYVRAYAANAQGTSYGNQIQFTTSNCFAYYTTAYDTLQNAFTSTVDSVTGNYAVNYKWDFGDGTTSISASPSHVYDYNGVYKLNMKIYTSSGDSCEYSRNIGKDNYGNIYRASGFILNVINSNATFISQNETKKNNYTIIPNPTSGFVNVAFSRVTNNISAKIMSLAGQTIMEQNNFNGNYLSFDLSNQASGMYILEVNENGIVTRNKLLKE